jgi:adenylosuccinate lyase
LIKAEQVWAVGPLDGRYRDRIVSLGKYVSEGGLISYRVRVEAHWLLYLADHSEIGRDLRLGPEVRSELERLAKGLEVKAIEERTNHDVKAVEYFIQQVLDGHDADRGVLSFIHFACTSEDINNLAYGLMLEEVRAKELLPAMDRIVASLTSLAKAEAGRPMMSRTHGQTASPTTLGKEVAVFAHRLQRQREKLADLRFDGKISGAVGNYNAHVVAYPQVDWINLARGFVENRLRLAWNPLTTQIENHDSIAEFADALRRFNTISIDLCRDFWGYISLGYFRQQVKEGEVGSSTMPHKVNPIDFENAEGNFGLSSALASHFAEKLPISRWQRDLSDSTVLRALGTMIGHAMLAMTSLTKGLSKLAVNEKAIAADLDGAWEVLGEAVQTVMRKHGVMDAYERLKAVTRGKVVTRDMIRQVVLECQELPEAIKDQLLAMTPSGYVGLAPRLAVEFLSHGGRS